MTTETEGMNVNDTQNTQININATVHTVESDENILTVTDVQGSNPKYDVAVDDADEYDEGDLLHIISSEQDSDGNLIPTDITVTKDEVTKAEQHLIDKIVEAGVLKEKQATAYIIRKVENHPREVMASKMGSKLVTAASNLRNANNRIEDVMETADIIRDLNPDEPRLPENTPDSPIHEMVAERAVNPVRHADLLEHDTVSEHLLIDYLMCAEGDMDAEEWAEKRGVKKETIEGNIETVEEAKRD